jgi:hypothetical protein
MLHLNNNFMNHTKLILSIAAFIFIPTLLADWKIVPGSEWEKELRVWDAAPELKLDVSWDGPRNSKNEAEGDGQLVWKDEKGEVSIYSGTMVGGKREGMGTWYHRSGSKFFGQWSDNLKHGEGEYWLKDGSYYKGAFEKDKPHGKGYYVNSDGVTYDGGFIDGKKNGSGTMAFPDGRVHSSNWINDEDKNTPAAPKDPYLVVGIDTKKYALDAEVYSDDQDFNSPFNTLTYRANWGDKSLSINPHWPFLEKWLKGGPINATDSFEVSVQPVFLELRVFNPSPEKITISSAEIDVERSAPDNEPILKVDDNYASFSAAINSFSDKPVNAVEISFNIIFDDIKNLQGSIYDNFKFKTTIPGFTSTTSWSFTNEMKELGFKTELFDEWARLSNEQGGEINFEQIANQKKDLLIKIKNSLKSFNQFNTSGEHIEVSGIIAGELTTEWKDDDGAVHSRKVRFNFPKCFFVSSLEFGAPGPTSGSYEIMLETKGRNYTRPFPYKRTIAPRGNDRFGIKLASNESSYQKFRIRLTTTDGGELLSPTCDLRFLVPGGYDWDKGFIIKD